MWFNIFTANGGSYFINGTLSAIAGQVMPQNLDSPSLRSSQRKKKRFFFVCFQEILFIYDFIQVALGTIDSHLENGNHSHEGYAVAQLVEALHYKPEGCRFDSQ